MPQPYALLRAGFPYLKTVGVKGVIDDPLDIAFGGDGRVYVLGSGPVRVTNLDHEDMGTIGERAYSPDYGSNGDVIAVEEGELFMPVQLVLDGEENLYISDEACHTISIFSKDGKFLSRWGEYGTGDGQLKRPSGIAFDADENLFVVDTMNHRIQKFTKEGRYLSSWGSFGTGEGEFNMPWGIAVDDDGDVYVSDWRSDRIQKFSPEGEFIFQFGETGSGKGQFVRPAGIAVDHDFDIYVCDWGNNRIQLLTPEGRYVQQFTGDATLSEPAIAAMRTRLRTVRLRTMADLETEKMFRGARSVRVNNDDGLMWVPDFESYRLQVYEKQAIQLEPHQIAPPLKAPSLQPN
jgi:DNA-binding beta-propeller fold protein YncE